MRWCAGMTGAVRRHCTKWTWTSEYTHTQPTVEQMPAIAAMRVGLYLRLLLFILDSLHDLVFFFFFCWAFGREIASRSHNSKHPPGPKDDGQSSKNSWCRWLLAIPFHLNFRLLLLLLLFFSLPYSIIISNVDNIPIPRDKEKERSTGPFDGAAVHTGATKISTKRHIR